MNGHAVFVSLAGFQINYLATYPAEISVLELGLLHDATFTWDRPQTKSNPAPTRGGLQVSAG